MEVQALTRYARMSPKKMRDISRIIQGRKAVEAVDYLALIPRKSAKLIAKTLKSAIANAEEKNADPTKLIVSESRVDEGPTLDRFQPKDRGRAHPIRKRTSHIHIAVEERGA